MFRDEIELKDLEKIDPEYQDLLGRVLTIQADFWYIKALDMFGRSDSVRDQRYIYWGLKRRTNAQAREEFIREVNPLIEKMGLTVPDPLRDRQYL